MRTGTPVIRAAVVGGRVLRAAARMTVRLGAAALFRRPEPRASIVGRTLAELFRSLGPAYVKLGQLLSTRRDLLDPEAIGHLEGLQDSLPPGPFHVVPGLFARELGLELHQAFSHLDPSPIGSASIATVYRGTLRDGRAVAVKVRRPDVAHQMRADLRLLRLAAAVLGRLPPLRLLPIVPTVNELCACLERQLDFALEAAANRRLRHALAFEREAVVPRLVEELCSGSILTMELVEGAPHPRNVPREQARTAVRAAVRALYRMIFVEGFIHCDLHQGNLRFLPDGRVALLDFGFMADLHDTGRLAFAKFFYAMGTNDGELCARLTVDMAASVAAGFRYQAFQADVVALVDGAARVEARDFRVADFVGRLFDLQRRHGIRGTNDFVMIILSLLVLEGIVKEVYPDLDFQREARSFIFRASIRGATPSRDSAPPPAHHGRGAALQTG